MTLMTDKADRQNANVDIKILRKIHDLRTEHHACSLRFLASHSKLSETAVRKRMMRMRGEFLDWNSVPGSVHLLSAGIERIGATVEVIVPVEVEPAPCSCGEQELLGGAAVEIGSVYHRGDGPCFYVPPGQSPDEALALITGAVAGPVAEGNHEPPTSPEGSQAGIPDTDPPGAPSSSET